MEENESVGTEVTINPLELMRDVKTAIDDVGIWWFIAIGIGLMYFFNKKRFDGLFKATGVFIKSLGKAFTASEINLMLQEQIEDLKKTIETMKSEHDIQINEVRKEQLNERKECDTRINALATKIEELNILITKQAGEIGELKGKLSNHISESGISLSTRKGRRS